MIASTWSVYVCPALYIVHLPFRWMEWNEMKKRRSKIYFPNIMFHYYYCFERKKRRWCFIRNTNVGPGPLLFIFFYWKSRILLFFCFVLSILIYKIYFFPPHSSGEKKLVRKKNLNWNRRNEMKEKMKMEEKNETQRRAQATFDGTHLFFVVVRLSSLRQTSFTWSLTRSPDKGSMIDAFKWPFHLCLLKNIIQYSFFLCVSSSTTAGCVLEMQFFIISIVSPYLLRFGLYIIYIVFV